MSDVTPPLMSNSFFESQPSNNSSEDELITMSTLRKILNQEIRVVMKKELEEMVLPIIHHVFETIAEDQIRGIVKEQLELAVRKLLAGAQSNRENEPHTSQPRRLTLQFRNDPSLLILTGKEIRAKENDFLEVVLIDDLSGQIVESGLEACAKVEIVALEGNENEEESRTLEEVNNNIFGEKIDRSLLSGDVILALKNGVGVLKNIKFGNDRNWMKKNKYKLSARAVVTFNGVHIREAKTESFIVKDFRSKYTKNCEVPELSDEVWRLKNITKTNKICERLNNVEDFLRELFKDSDQLKHLARMKPKNWDTTVKHARKCKIDKRMSCYADSQKKMVVVFNLVEQVLGVVSRGQYTPIEKLSDEAKGDAHKLAMDALDNLKDVVHFDDEASILRHFSSLYASVDARGANTEVSEMKMIGECSYNQLYAPNPATSSSMSYAGDTPSQVHSVTESINAFNMNYKELHMQNANFNQASDKIPRMELSDKEKEIVSEVLVPALDNKRVPVFSYYEASLREDFSSSYPPMAPTSFREMEYPKGIEASELINECYQNPAYAPYDILSSINTAGGIPIATQPIPQSTTVCNVMDAEFHVEISKESPEGRFLYDNDTFHLYSSHTNSQTLKRPRGQNLEASGMTCQCSFSNSNASSNNNTRSINSVGCMPWEVQSSSHSCCNNDFTEQATISASPETMRCVRQANKQTAAAKMMLGDRPSKRWVLLINVLSLKRVVRRTKMFGKGVESNKAFVSVSKRRRVQ